MSLQHRRTVQCPQCGAAIEFTYWQSINTDVPNAIEDTISGKLFEAKCEKCGHQAHISYPMLFNDMIHNVMIYYTLPENLEETEKAIETSKQMMSSVSCRMRIVQDQSSLREKVAIFNAGLDDRVVELLKLSVAAQFIDQRPDANLKGLYFVPGDEPSIDIVLEEGAFSAPVTMEMYRSIEQQFQPQLSAGDREYHIDQAWALALVSAVTEEKPL